MKKYEIYRFSLFSGKNRKPVNDVRGVPKSLRRFRELPRILKSGLGGVSGRFKCVLGGVKKISEGIEEFWWSFSGFQQVSGNFGGVSGV